MIDYKISPAHLKYFEGRNIDAETVDFLRIYSCRRAPKDQQDRTPIPDINGNMIAYPFFDEHGEVVNTKYVARKEHQKLYFQTAGGKKIFYNLQAALDPVLQEPEGPALVIAEGQNDVAAIISAGHRWVIGVPDGGSPDHTETGKAIPMKPDEELDPDDDRKFEFIKNCWDLLLPVRKIVIFTDFDSVGLRLKDELSRRLDKVRCYSVSLPEDLSHPVVKAMIKDKSEEGGGKEIEITRPVKDPNEIVNAFGPEELIGIIQRARPMPMNGIYTLDDYEDRPIVTFSTGFRALDPHIQLYDTAFSVATGLPQSGKSLLWNQIAYNMAELYGWVTVFGSFEAPIKPEIQRQLRCFFIKRPQPWSQREVDDADSFIRRHFVFITRDPSGLSDVSATPEWLCEQFEIAVIRYGARLAIADPWNQLDHKRRRDEMRDEYTINRIRLIKDTGARLKMATTVVAHPTAEAGRAAKNGDVLSMYDMADGAAWNNAAEFGMVVHRRGMRASDTICEPYIRKVKFQQATGCSPGNCAIQFLPEEGRFDPWLIPSMDRDAPHDDGRGPYD